MAVSLVNLVNLLKQTSDRAQTRDDPESDGVTP